MYFKQVEKCLTNSECYIIVVFTNTIIFGIKVIKATVQSVFFSNQAASLILTWISALTTITSCRFSEHAALFPVHSLLYILFSLPTRPLSTQLLPTHPSLQLSYQLLCECFPNMSPPRQPPLSGYYATKLQNFFNCLHPLLNTHLLEVK